MFRFIFICFAIASVLLTGAGFYFDDWGRIIAGVSLSFIPCGGFWWEHTKKKRREENEAIRRRISMTSGGDRGYVSVSSRRDAEPYL